MADVISEGDGLGDLPETPIFDRPRALNGYRLNKMAMSLADAANRARFKADEAAYLDSFGLTAAEKTAVLQRDWRELMRQGGNLFYIMKISAIDPVPLTAIGAHQAGLTHEAFLRDRLGKR